eukprot:SAG22_NODE_3130_length_1914_cov_1.947107_2_plen_75_part_00
MRQLSPLSRTYLRIRSHVNKVCECLINSSSCLDLACESLLIDITDNIIDQRADDANHNEQKRQPGCCHINPTTI